MLRCFEGVALTADTAPATRVIDHEVAVATQQSRVWSTLRRDPSFWIGAIGVVALWGAIGLAGAIRGFRWEPREA
jgi:hypothetical protein